MPLVKKFVKIGNSSGIIFPIEILKMLGIDDPSRAEVEIIAEKGRIVLRPIVEKKSKKKSNNSF